AALGRLRYLKWIELSHNETVDDDALTHLARLKRLNTLYLHNTKITGIGFSPLAHLSFEYLDLSRSPVTDKGLEQISRLRRLKYLGLENCAVTDVGIAHLAALRQLQELRLTNTDVSDAALVHLEKLPKLKSLSLNSTRVSAEGVTRLAEALPNCQIHKDVNLGEVPENELLFAEGEQPTKDAIEAKLASLAVDHYLQ